MRSGWSALLQIKRRASMRWPSWDVLLFDGKMIDCHTTAASDVKKHLIKRDTLQWWMEEEEEGLSEGVWFEPATAFSRRKCDDKWTPRHAASARTWFKNGAITQESFHHSGRVKQHKFQICDGLTISVHFSAPLQGRFSFLGLTTRLWTFDRTASDIRSCHSF